MIWIGFDFITQCFERHIAECGYLGWIGMGQIVTYACKNMV